MMKLLPKQNLAIKILKDRKTKYLIYGGAAGGAKSSLGVFWLIESCQKFAGSRWLLGRSKLKTLKQTTLQSFFELSSKLGISEQWSYNVQSGEIVWDNGSVILLKDLFLYPSDPNFDSLGSLELTGAFIDECNQLHYKAWQIVSSRIRYRLLDYCHICGNEEKKEILNIRYDGNIEVVSKWICGNNHKTKGLIPKTLGTCNPAKNWVYNVYYHPHTKKDIDDDKKFIAALPTDNPFLAPSYLESLLALDSNSRERLYYGNWEYDDDPSVLCEYDKILDIFTNTFVVDRNEQMYLTADIASENDKFIVCVWRGWEMVFIHVIDNKIARNKTDGKKITETIGELAFRFKVPVSNITFDSSGYGMYLRGYYKNAVPFVSGARPMEQRIDEDIQEPKEYYKNLKSQCYFYLARKINNSELYISAKISEEHKTCMIDELSAIKDHTFGTDQKKSVTPKKELITSLGHSSDFSDAMKMRAIFDFKAKSVSVDYDG